MAVLFWLVIMLICMVVEYHTGAFVAVFIGVGAAIAFVFAFANASFPVQALIWLVASGAGLASLRPLALKKFPRHRSADLSKPTTSPMTDLTGTVESEVGDENHPGRVKVRGESWKAVTEQGTPIPDGTLIVVRKSLGTTLWVEPK